MTSRTETSVPAVEGPDDQQAPNPVAAAEPIADVQSGSRRLPNLAVALLCVASACIAIVVDRSVLARPATPRIAVAEKGAVILEALLREPGLNYGQAREKVGSAVLRVISKYERAGYLVVDAARAKGGLGGEAPGEPDAYVIDAIPLGAIDITPELRAAVGLPSLAAGREKKEP